MFLLPRATAVFGVVTEFNFEFNVDTLWLVPQCVLPLKSKVLPMNISDITKEEQKLC